MLSWLPESISSYGWRIDRVIEIIYVIVGTWFVVVQAVLFFFLIRYRRGKSPRASYVLGNSFKSLSWVMLPVVAIVGFDVAIDLAQSPVWHDIKIEKPADAALTVRVKARQFFWEFIYAGNDGVWDSPDDVKSLTDLYVPAGGKVIVELEAEDVIHSFWVPQLRLKQDIVPGRRIVGWFQADKTGDFEIACAELCGVGHGNMKGMLHVVPAIELKARLDEVAARSAEEIY